MKKMFHVNDTMTATVDHLCLIRKKKQLNCLHLDNFCLYHQTQERLPYSLRRRVEYSGFKCHDRQMLPILIHTSLTKNRGLFLYEHCELKSSREWHCINHLRPRAKSHCSIVSAMGKTLFVYYLDAYFFIVYEKVIPSSPNLPSKILPSMLYGDQLE